MRTKDISVLLVEDSEAHARLVRRAFGRVGWSVDVVVTVGEAEELLSGEKHFDMVFVDLNLRTERRGEDVIRWIRSHERLSTTPVIVLTTSTAERDIEASYSLGANAYLEKPATRDGFAQLAARTQGFWGLVRLPVAL